MITYDIETYPNVFTYTDIDEQGRVQQFEISDRKNELYEMCDYLDGLCRSGTEMVGYNNLSFDYPVIHYIMQTRAQRPDAQIIKYWANRAINSQLRPECTLIPQIDLMKMWHFDNKAKITSLKLLEFNMRMDSIEDLPYHHEDVLTSQQIDFLLEYNKHDTKATKLFLGHSMKKLNFRRELGGNCMNHNDTKIGEQYFIRKLEAAGLKCYTKGGPRQTQRNRIKLSDAILTDISFDEPAFQQVLNTLKSMEIGETRGAVEGIKAVVNNFQFDFGLGGIHGSISSEVVKNDEEWMIEDWDVASYYPNLVISNRFYPEHLGEEFCDIYDKLYQDRKKYPKSTHPEINGMLKLALNGVFGKSNSIYSPFYDPLLTMKITLNGQLLLCKLAESLFRVAGLRMLQANTDGITVRYKRKDKELVHQLCSTWEYDTGLELESAEYNMMAIRDVNHYIAQYSDGSVKRKGAYEYDLDWHQNHSMLVVKKAAEAHLLHGTGVREFIENHEDTWDFMLRVKPDRKTVLEQEGEHFKGVTRYYIQKDGKPLYKIMPPLGPSGQYKKGPKASKHDYEQWHREKGNVYNEKLHTKSKSVHGIRRSAVNSGYGVKIVNKMDCKTSIDDIDYGFYVNEAEKLLNVFNEKQAAK